MFLCVCTSIRRQCFCSVTFMKKVFRYEIIQSNITFKYHSQKNFMRNTSNSCPLTLPVLWFWKIVYTKCIRDLDWTLAVRWLFRVTFENFKIKQHLGIMNLNNLKPKAWNHNNLSLASGICLAFLCKHIVHYSGEKTLSLKIEWFQKSCHFPFQQFFSLWLILRRWRQHHW